jgi:serine/threonine-protein kinase
MALLATALEGRYVIEREIGSGGTAVVFRARDLRHERLVAIKVLRPELARSLGTDRFLREIRIAASLTHPHILPVHDSGEAADLLYYVMPYVEGESLRSRLLREGALPVDDALRIARETADALAYAHSRGVVHRDIKPGNILLIGGHAVVADFGIATATGIGMDDETLTSPGLVIGTPAYMSPEQARGEALVDGRSDLYSLGCVLYEMLAGQPPFTGPTAHAVLARHSQEIPDPIRSRRASVSLEVEQALDRLLEKHPADRFGTATQFAAALPGDTEEPPPRARRPRPVRVAVALTCVLLIGALLWLPRSGTTNDRLATVGVAVLPFGDPAGPSGGARSDAHLLLADALQWVPRLYSVDGTDLVGAGQGWRAVPLGELLSGARRLGAKYVVLGGTTVDAGRVRLSVDVYAVRSGERVSHVDDTVAAGRVASAISRVAATSGAAIARREGLVPGLRALEAASASAAARGYLLSGQAKFWTGDYDAAAASFRQAVDADSFAGLAHYRLSVAEEWRHDFAAAAQAVKAGLRYRDRLDQRWVRLLEGQRYYLEGRGDSAISAFEDVVLEHPDDVDGWTGLAESLFHLGGYTGHQPAQAVAAFERAAQLDSLFLPGYWHLVDLALVTGDGERARRYVARMRGGTEEREARDAAILLRFGGPEVRREALERLRSVGRQELSRLVAVWLRMGSDPATADTLAQLIAAGARTPDDRTRAAQFRFVALLGQGRVADGVGAWRRDAAELRFDPYVVLAMQAGFPVESLAVPMLAYARELVADGRSPDFTRPPWDPVQQTFSALVDDATVRGEAGEVRRLLARVEAAAPDSTAPVPLSASLRDALEARLALLSGDTAHAVRKLERSVEYIPEPYTWYYPLAAMPVQRLTLGRLLSAQGAATRADEWLRSFGNTWSVGDHLLARRPR